MVRAILEGRKTQTRRVIKPQPTFLPERHDVGITIAAALIQPEGSQVKIKGGNKPPFGPNILLPLFQKFKIGERLWVKETFRLAHKTTTEAKVIYRCDDPEVWGAPWKPSIFMPRWASRITLEITDVRVERVQSITPEDAEAEGLISDEFPIGGNYVKKYGLEGWQHQWFRQSPVDAYERLWDSLNAKRGFGWSVNPWVWVLEFRKICVTSS